MKIVHYIDEFRFEQGGVVRAVLDLCGALAGRPHELTLLTHDPSDVPESWKKGEGPPRVIVLRRQAGRLPRLSRSAVAAAQQCIEGADVVHLHGLWVPMCLQLARVARQSGVPYVLSLHGMLDDWCMAQKGAKKRLYLRLAGRRLLERAAAVHCTAAAERDQSSKWYPNGSSAVIPLVFDAAPFEDLPAPELARQRFPQAFTDETVMLFIGRLHPIKRIELLIEGAAQLRDAGLQIKVLIAGTGELRYENALRRYVEQKQLSARVEFLGFVSGRRKVSLYQVADVFVQPSHHENWGFVVVEALACGTPVVTTRAVNTWPELLVSGGATIIEPTPEAMASAVRAILEDQSKRRTMGQKGRAWVLEHLSVDRVVAQYEHLYQRVSQSVDHP